MRGEEQQHYGGGRDGRKDRNGWVGTGALYECQPTRQINHQTRRNKSATPDQICLPSLSQGRAADKFGRSLLQKVGDRTPMLPYALFLPCLQWRKELSASGLDGCSSTCVHSAPRLDRVRRWIRSRCYFSRTFTCLARLHIGFTDFHPSRLR